ncbi:hypothetical protein BN7_6557 [Wickerhamomyces ciferrii]|uniref:Alpha/beta hydrolase fold-3 domain-containing protein n=1 Tax=Wickerhamomyces ciferrii (strain ATCC 14091 / BCRC 22168 / CBS 111 / JCM 3599 / NBRC 0793 / NRRL Y-1031 F-60-10) TaxID=1206466 RepID=K0KUR8_WICCF|nr:uncharacterized protein BN7_6557 [Wickerhamomyces ciferrii]CCH46951.1 hypothetical protein BN7_6557 [Wickerhamomyces ciferrii]
MEQLTLDHLDHMDHTIPHKNIVFALAQGIWELPIFFYKSLTNKFYSNHSLGAKFEISLLKSFIKNLHYKQLQIFSPNKSIKYQLLQQSNNPKFEKFNNFAVEYLPGTIWLREIPDRTPQDPVILFYHGGAYLFQFRSDTHLKYLTKLVEKLPSNYSILLIDYPLQPHPTPLDYNLQLWDELFNNLNLENIITMGDSAGCNLILETIANLQQDEELGFKFPKICFKHVLISPWIDLSLNLPDPRITNLNNDILDPIWSRRWGEIYHNNSSSLINLEEFKFNKDLIQNSIIIVGELEILYEGVVKFSEKNGINYIVEKQGIHDQITMENLLGYKINGKIFNQIIDFIVEK